MTELAVCVQRPLANILLSQQLQNDAVNIAMNVIEIARLKRQNSTIKEPNGKYPLKQNHTYECTCLQGKKSKIASSVFHKEHVLYFRPSKYVQFI